MKKGFTLVELLAVIVILSVIAIITVPIIGNVIEESKKKALEQSAYGLVESANYYAIKYEGEHGFEFENGKQISSDKLDYKGSIEGSGKLYIDNNGDISLCINTDKYYVIKNYNSGIEIKDKNEYGCSIEQDPLTNKYVAYLDNGENGPISVYTKSESDERYVLKTVLNDYALKSELDKTNSAVIELNNSISSISNTVRYNSDTDRIQVLLNGEWVDSLHAGAQKRYIIEKGKLGTDITLATTYDAAYSFASDSIIFKNERKGNHSYGIISTNQIDFTRYTRMYIQYTATSTRNGRVDWVGFGLNTNKFTEPAKTGDYLGSSYSVTNVTEIIDITNYTEAYLNIALSDDYSVTLSVYNIWVE